MDEFTINSVKNFVGNWLDLTLRPKIKILKKDERAVTPTKAHPSDIGYDLTIISHDKKISERTDLYDTGIAVKPPAGFYIEILPRSSFGKSGYVLSNSVGVIDPSYRGTLKVMVTRVDDFVPAFEIPFRGFQMVLRKCESNAEIEEVAELDATERGDGGFGSSG